MHKFRVPALVCFLVLALASTAYAEGFAVYEWSARGVALGGATVARKPDASAIASNPAALTQLEGIHLMAGATSISPKGKINFDDAPYATGPSQLRQQDWIMPHAYYAHRVADRVSLGIGEFSRFGLGFRYSPTWQGAANVYKVELQTASVNPNVAVKVTDDFSFAVGVELMYLDILIKKQVNGMVPGLGPVPGAAINIAVDGDSVAFGANIAAHYKLNDEWSVGALYRAPVKHNVEGDMTVKTSVPGLPGGSSKTTYDANATVTMPQSFAFGIAWEPTEKLSIEAGAIWTDWSSFDALDIYSDGGPNSLSEKNWENAWRFNFGIEYALTDWLDLRAGYVWDNCPVTDAHEDYLIPTAGRKIYSAGLGFKFDNLAIDLAYGYLEAEERDYGSRPAEAVYKGTTHSAYSHITSLSFSYKF